MGALTPSTAGQSASRAWGSSAPRGAGRFYRIARGIDLPVDGATTDLG